MNAGEKIVRFRNYDVVPLERAALFLDLDGTLLPFEKDPGKVAADDQLLALLGLLEQRLGGRLAIISGRAIEDVDRILDSSIERVSGSHGLARRRRWGDGESPEPHPNLPLVWKMISSFADQWPGLLVERKPLSVALHYRAAPEAALAARDVARTLADATSMACQEGDQVVEVLPPGPDKGAAIRAWMAEAPFNGTTPVFIGDDMTDEPAFRAAAILGGVGVCVGESWRRYATARLGGSEAVLSWLTTSLATGAFRTRGLR